MDFSNSSTKQGLVEDCDFLVNTDSTSYPLTNKAASANRALDEVIALILSTDGRWQFDDTNYTDLPIGTTNLVASQQDYSIDTSFLDITRIECKDANGTWILLQPIDQKDIIDRALTEFLSTAGNPVYYDKLGNSIFLYPKPSYNSTGGLKVYFQRRASYFASTDTTKQAGFAKHLHRFISLKMAYDYAVAKMLSSNKIVSLTNEIERMKLAIKEFYSIRKKDEKVVMVARNTLST